jgi:hypothetical protein
MKNFSLFQGCLLSCMSAWYHIAGFLASWFIDTDNIKTVTLYLGAENEEFQMSESEIKN